MKLYYNCVRKISKRQRKEKKKRNKIDFFFLYNFNVFVVQIMLYRVQYNTKFTDKKENLPIEDSCSDALLNHWFTHGLRKVLRFFTLQFQANKFQT